MILVLCLLAMITFIVCLVMGLVILWHWSPVIVYGPIISLFLYLLIKCALSTK